MRRLVIEMVYTFPSDAERTVVSVPVPDKFDGWTEIQQKNYIDDALVEEFSGWNVQWWDDENEWTTDEAEYEIEAHEDLDEQMFFDSDFSDDEGESKAG